MIEFQFTTDWFEITAKPIWDKFIPQIKPTKILEVGSYEGASACYLIGALANDSDLEIHCVAGSGLNAERNWLANNRDTARRFVMASIEVVALIKNDRDAFARAMAKWFNITDPTVVDRMHAEVAGIPEKPYPTIEGIRHTMEVYNYREMRQHRVEDFYDASFVTELDQSGFIDDLYR